MTTPDNDRQISPETAADIEDAEQNNKFVWYACYSSNLCEERFNCYLSGGRVDGMSYSCTGARDATPAADSLIRWMPYRVFFAYAMRSAWGYGGVAMLDVTPNQTHKCFMRLYKVTLQQFNDIIAQENNLKPPIPTASSLTCELLGKLRLQAPGSLRVQFESGSYPAVAYLGEQDDVPIVTFTCLTETANKFLCGAFSAARPANNYLTVLRKGLKEWNVDKAEAYWEGIIAEQFTNLQRN